MSYDSDERLRSQGDGDGSDFASRDEVYSKRVLAGKRTYFFDVKSTRSGEDFFVTITESKRVGEHRYEKHKIFLYKEDFGKFVAAIHEVIGHIKSELLPAYDFRGLPPLITLSEEEAAHFVSESE
ncbi:MAG: DUF3276 family protein [Rhodothermales bacterium]|jgi:hypothetical protein